MNIINAIINLVQNPIFELVSHYQNRNRANFAGDALENYIKDLFAGSFDLSESEKIQKHSEIFSYLGNNSNPPDMMLKNGDAIEVKKIETPNSALALNSSYPKAKLLKNSTMISNACRNAENWTEKDLIYVVGVVNKQNQLKNLCMVYGEDYCAEDYFKQKIQNTKNELKNIGVVDLSLGGILIKNPFEFFKDIYSPNKNANFNFMALINDKKWNSFNNQNLLKNIENISIKDVKIKNLQDFSQINSAKLITFYC